MISRIFVQRFDWNGITIEVSYEPDWLNLSSACGAPVAHLEVRSLAPDRVALPISETGYRSAFPPAATVTAMGGPLSYVRAWLDDAARSPEWRDRQEAARQLSFL